MCIKEVAMRKLVVFEFLSIDGVMQAPGGPDEDPSGGFKLGGWVAPYFDDDLGNMATKQLDKPFALLLGRRTYEIFAAYWPYADAKNPFTGPFNSAKKYVASRTLKKLDWSNSELIKGDVAKEIKKLKEQPGPELHVYGSGNLVQTLLKHDLVDELRLKIFPIMLGSGKRLFAEGAFPAGFDLTENGISKKGVIVATYARAGDVKTGPIEQAVPSEAELYRREKLRKEAA
jgi:dihydrofolate reductase